MTLVNAEIQHDEDTKGIPEGATPDEIRCVCGATSNIQAQLDCCIKSNSSSAQSVPEAQTILDTCTNENSTLVMTVKMQLQHEEEEYTFTTTIQYQLNSFIKNISSINLTGVVQLKRWATTRGMTETCYKINTKLFL